MRRELFESFYNEIVSPIAHQLVAKNCDCIYIGNIGGVYEEYLNQKTALKYLIKGNTRNQSDSNDVLLDGHKVASCITCAIIRTRLISSCKSDDPEQYGYELEKSNRLNEQLALLCGLTCLLEYMAADDCYLYSDRFDKSKTKLKFPKTRYEERSTYLDSLVRGLYYSNVISNINPLLLSHIFYMIEQYHRKCIELEEYKHNFTS